MRVELPRRPLGSVTPLFLLALVSAVVPGCPAHAVTSEKSTIHTTFIVFADRYMPGAQWDDLLTSLRRSLSASEPEVVPIAPVNVLRGDAVAPGLQLHGEVVSIYLHGECVLSPRPRTTVTGALGWVYRVHGQIPPFIHVDCEELTQMLGPMALVLTTNRRHQIMAEAVARVVLHEWVHISTQSAAHAHDGVTKSTFGIADLLAEDDEFRHHPGRFTSRRWPEL